MKIDKISSGELCVCAGKGGGGQRRVQRRLWWLSVSRLSVNSLIVLLSEVAHMLIG